MAKAKKPPKNPGSKPDNSSDAVVLHQKLCLSVDFDNHRLFGYTELEIAVPDNGVIGLHAENLEIERVTVDGEPAEFDVFPHYQPVEIENRWCSVSSLDSAADAAGVTYISALERELVPNLLILCRKTIAAAKQQQDHGTVENGGLSNGKEQQNVKLIRIDYWVEKAEAGLHFNDKVLHTNSQIRRAHCWFPCMDDTFQRCCYDLEFTVPYNFVAVSNGNLLYQVLSQDDPPRKTFVYKLNIPVSARWISLAVAPFQILPDHHISLLSHMCMTGNLSKLQNTVGFFNSAFRHYEDYLKTSFPFGSYKQVFIPPEMVLSSVSLGASMSIFSSHILFDEKVIDQTIDTRIKLSYALAQQWFGVFISPETPNDEWLIEGLAGFLTDTFIKDYLGNNEARYRRYKANCSVCKADDSGATTLSPSSSSKDLYGTQTIGLYGRIRSWKSVAVLQMLEKQMGPDLFKGILRTVVSRAQDDIRPRRTLSTKEFRQFANKHGNLERPFLKEFFQRWVETCGCPVLRMGFSYNKRKNMVELAAFRECTAVPNVTASASKGNIDLENQSDSGWPGMMTIKVHELDGTHDHLLTMAGDAWQLLEIKCHSRLATKRIQKPKKGPKPDGSDDNADTVTAVDMRSGTESPLLWVRADPEMEYLAEIHFNQPLQMWINQLEKDRDVVAQVQTIATLEELPNISFPLINALANFVADSKAFWRVRIEAAFALAKIATEDTDWAGMINLVKFYRAKRFDPTIGLPKRNNFHDVPEYFVLEAIPHAIATVRTVDDKSPREAVEFVLQVLKYNDNNGNFYSDVFWLAALIEAVGELEFGQQSIMFLSSLLKRIDRLLQFDRLMPSYNGILTVSCIRTLTQMALKLSEFIPLDRVVELVKQFQDLNAIWQIRIEASRALLDIEFHCKGIDAALLLFIKHLEGEPTLRGQAKLGVHMIRLCQISAVSRSSDDVKSQTLVTLLRLLESRIAFCNVFLRHHLFCILQVLAGRSPTLYIVPRDHMHQTGYAEICKEQRNNFLAFINQIKPLEAPIEIDSPFNEGLEQEIINEVHAISNGQEQSMRVEEVSKDADTTSCSQLLKFPAVETSRDADITFNSQELETLVEGTLKDVDATSHRQMDKVPVQDVLKDAETISNNQMDPAQDILKDADPISNIHKDQLVVQDIFKNAEAVSINQTDKQRIQEALKDSDNIQMDKLSIHDTHKDADTISNSCGRKMPIVKIRVKQAGTSNKGEGAASMNFDRFQSAHKEIDPAASSSVSVDAPQRNLIAVSVSNLVTEEVNSCQGRGSQMTVSIGSAKVPRESDELGRELQCTADSSNIHLHTDLSSPNVPGEEPAKTPVLKEEFRRTSVVAQDVDGASLSTANREMGKHEERKKKKEKKRKKGDHKSHRDDPEYLERKRLKKEKKQKDKEMAKLMKEEKLAILGENLLKKDGLDSKLECQEMAVNDEKKAVLTDSPDNMEGSSMKMECNRQRPSDHDLSLEPISSKNNEANVSLMSNEHKGPHLVLRQSENKPKPPEGGSGTKLRIKIKSRMLDRQ